MTKKPQRELLLTGKAKTMKRQTGGRWLEAVVKVLPQSDPGCKAPCVRKVTGGEKPTRQTSSRTLEQRDMESRNDEGLLSSNPRHPNAL